ncbi:unnamed protein product [Effrenium voratum]|nr:unnamed protein product [Effrenium voratum]
MDLEDLQNSEACALRQRLLEELEEERREFGEDGAHLFQAPRLARFLQGNNGSIEEAAAHFRRMLQWYKEADMCKRRQSVVDKEWNVEVVEGANELFEIMCIDVSKRMQDGTMLWLQRDGLAQIERIMKLGDEELAKRLSLICELREIHLDRRSEELGRLSKIVQIRDLTGLNISVILRNRAAMKRLADVFKVVSTAYPETMTKMIIVNPPAGFNMLWMAVQPMLNNRIKQKFVFIPDGPFEFPQQLAQIGGLGALHALADLSRRPGEVELVPGRSHFHYQELSKGTCARWAFQAPGSLQFAVIFFECAERGPKVHEVFPTQAVTGAVSGHCGPLGLEGMLWFTWYNDSWASTLQVLDLKVSLHEEPDEVVRHPSSSSVLLRKHSASLTGSAFCCIPWLVGDVDVSEDDEVVRHHHARSPSPIRVRRRKVVDDEPEIGDSDSWEGGLGSDAFAKLVLQLAALVLLLATAQTARSYLGRAGLWLFG